MQYGNDYRQAAASSATTDNLAINFATTPVVNYVAGSTPSGPADVTSFNGIAAANIEEINGIAFTSIEEINGIS